MIKAKKKNSLNMSQYCIRGGQTYYVDDVNCAPFIAEGDGWIESQNPKVVFPKLNLEDSAQKNVLFVRPGGFGDLLFLTPLFREIKKRRPDMNIFVSCFEFYKDILQDVSWIPYPLLCEDVERVMDAVVWLENIVENNPNAEKRHYIDMLEEWVGIKISEKACFFRTSEEDAVELKLFAPERAIFIQPSASAQTRTWPIERVHEFCKLATAESYQIIMSGSRGQIQGEDRSFFINLTTKNLTVKNQAWILSKCAGACAPDSFWCHMAGALDIPTVAIYGAFPWQIRTAYHPSILGINATMACAPCFHHGRTGAFPPHKPCSKANKCLAIEEITADLAWSKLKNKMFDMKEIKSVNALRGN